MSIPWRIYDIARDFYQEAWIYTGLKAPVQDLSGRVILITGANAGLGKESARQLALMKPAKIIMTARNMQKGQQAVDEVKRSTGFQNIQLEHLDLCSMDSVNTLSRKLMDAKQPLHVIMCNAGLGALPGHAQRTGDGFDEMFQGNNLGHYLLTINLLPLLTASSTPDSPGRLIFLSSLAAKFAFSFDLNSYANPNRLSGNAYYPISKLMAVLMAQGLGQRYEGKGIVAHSCHPGTVRTEFADKFPSLMQAYVFPTIYKLFGRPLDEGAATQVYIASAPEAAKTTGKYWSNMRVSPPALVAENAQLSRQFVELCDELVGKYKL